MSPPTLHDIADGMLLRQSPYSETPGSRANRGSSRRRIRQVHLWLGLIVGVHLIAMGVSGSALVFREQWNAALEPAVPKQAAVSKPEQVAARVSQMLARDFPGFERRMLVFSEDQRPLG